MNYYSSIVYIFPYACYSLLSHLSRYSTQYIYAYVTGRSERNEWSMIVFLKSRLSVNNSWPTGINILVTLFPFFPFVFCLRRLYYWGKGLENGRVLSRISWLKRAFTSLLENGKISNKMQRSFPFVILYIQNYKLYLNHALLTRKVTKGRIQVWLWHHSISIGKNKWLINTDHR